MQAYTPTVSGQNYTLDLDMFTIFGITAWRVGAKKLFRSSVSPLFFETDTTIASAIEENIERNCIQNHEYISAIEIKPVSAALLFLEERLKREHIVRALEKEGAVMFPEVSFWIKKGMPSGLTELRLAVFVENDHAHPFEVSSVDSKRRKC